jgi:DNA-binding NtrC family response regulator
MTDRILIVEDETSCREGLKRLLEAWGYRAETAESAEQALDIIDTVNPTAIITDLVLPGITGIELVRKLRYEYPVPVIMLSGQGTIETAVEATKLGVEYFLEKPVEPEKLRVLLEKMAETWELLSEIRRLRAELRDKGSFGRLDGISEKMREVFRQIETVAPSPLSILLVGESGTGKELVARTLHDLSPQNRNEFIALNCAAIPATLLESEIFGHERGAFTGAVQRKIGCFEMAHKGMLFLDEIAEMDEALQAKLLRVLQEQRFRRIGGREVIEADVRVIAATNRDPKEAIAEGKLREDLYYRLNAFIIQLPPLRERVEDIQFLANILGRDYAKRTGTQVPKLSRNALYRMMAYPWPGNVRELKNVIERAALLCGGEVIETDHLPPEVTGYAPTDRGEAVSALTQPVAEPEEENGDRLVIDIGSSMEEAEKAIIRSTLKHTGGNKTRAARILGVSLKTMHNKVKKYDL